MGCDEGVRVAVLPHGVVKFDAPCSALEASKYSQQCTLAAAAWAEQRGDAPPLQLTVDVEIEILQGCAYRDIQHTQYTRIGNRRLTR